MTIEDIDQMRFDVTCNIFGEDLVVTYDPMVIKCNEAEPTVDMMGLVQLLTRTIVSWDLFEEGGQETMVPVTVERLSTLPFVFLNMVLEQILNDKDKRAARALQTMRDNNMPPGETRYAD